MWNWIRRERTGWSGGEGCDPESRSPPCVCALENLREMAKASKNTTLNHLYSYGPCVSVNKTWEAAEMQLGKRCWDPWDVERTRRSKARLSAKLPRRPLPSPPRYCRSSSRASSLLFSTSSQKTSAILSSPAPACDLSLSTGAPFRFCSPSWARLSFLVDTTPAEWPLQPDSITSSTRCHLPILSYITLGVLEQVILSLTAMSSAALNETHLQVLTSSWSTLASGYNSNRNLFLSRK